MFKLKKVIAAYCIFQMAVSFAQAQDTSVALDNGIIRREISLADKHVTTKSLVLLAKNTQFIGGLASDFSVRLDDVLYSGQSLWKQIRSRDTTDAKGGKGLVLSLEPEGKKFSIELIYLLYPDMPVVYKSLRITNHSKEEIKVEAVDVENLQLNWSPTDMWVLRQYARYKWLGPYLGDWNDPLIIVHDFYGNRGVAVGNEAISVSKRTSVYQDGKSLTAGLTHPEQASGFRKWLHAGEQWTSPAIFTALYADCQDGSVALNTIVPDFVRKYAGMRIEQLPKKPMFVYNTWFPFYHNINEKLVRELAKAASECGVEEFIIDDGWQLTDWSVNKEKFPKGLRPVFDYIKSLGMKPGLWVSLAWDYNHTEHPEWYVRDRNGNLTNLHTENKNEPRKTACLGTDWYDYIKNIVLRLVEEHGLSYIKLDLAIATSAYAFGDDRSGCFATDHPYHKDREESYGAIFQRCMQLFDELHVQAPDLFIDCTFETAGKLQLMDYGIAKHAEGNWLSNIQHENAIESLRMRNLAWGRTPALPATSLVIGNLRMEGEYGDLNFKSLTGTLPIMLGDPRKLTSEEKQRYKSWMEWLTQLETRHSYMSFRQDLPGFGEPMEGFWDGFCRLNTETGSGGLVGVFRHGSTEETRTVTVPWLNFDKIYQVKQGVKGKIIATLTGKDLAEKGFLVRLDKKYDGELFEIIENP